MEEVKEDVATKGQLRDMAKGLREMQTTLAQLQKGCQELGDRLVTLEKARRDDEHRINVLTQQAAPTVNVEAAH